jgi:hypothetical protein
MQADGLAKYNGRHAVETYPDGSVSFLVHILEILRSDIGGKERGEMLLKSLVIFFFKGLHELGDVS